MNNKETNIYFDKFKYKLTKIVVDHQKTADICLSIASSINNFAISGSPLSFIDGGVRAIVNLSRSFNQYSHNFFNIKNGWTLCVSADKEKPLFSLLKQIVIKYKFKRIEFQYDKEAYIGTYDSPVGVFGLDDHGIWIKLPLSCRDDSINFLINEKMKEISSNFFSIASTKGEYKNYSQQISYDLQDEDVCVKNSKTSAYYLEEIKSFTDKNIKRSILFTGPPGTGKTTLAQTLIHNLKFKTLKFKYESGTTNIELVKFLTRVLNIEALVVDDFDQTTGSVELLDFMTWIHDNTKLVIFITNSLATFHPAILRPQRVDQVFTINHLDSDVSISVFGKDNQELIDKTSHWPIAFINELYYRMQAKPNIDIQKNFDELELRVQQQIQSLKK